MVFLKVLAVASRVSTDFQKSMADRQITIKEMCNIVDNALKEAFGKGLDEIGFAIRKTKDGKTKVEFVF